MVWVPSKELPVPAQLENDPAAIVARPRAIRLDLRFVFIVVFGKMLPPVRIVDRLSMIA
jgi:hypothetical protein